MRWMGCHLTGPAGRLPAPQRCKLVNMEANYCCPCDQGIIQPYHNTRARRCACPRHLCRPAATPPSDPVVSPCTLLLNLLNRGQPRPRHRTQRSVNPPAGRPRKRSDGGRKTLGSGSEAVGTNTLPHMATSGISRTSKPNWPPAKRPEVLLALPRMCTSAFAGPLFSPLIQPSPPPPHPPPLETRFLLWRDLQQ